MPRPPPLHPPFTPTLILVVSGVRSQCQKGGEVTRPIGRGPTVGNLSICWERGDLSMGRLSIRDMIWVRESQLASLWLTFSTEPVVEPAEQVDNHHNFLIPRASSLLSYSSLRSSQSTAVLGSSSCCGKYEYHLIMDWTSRRVSDLLRLSLSVEQTSDLTAHHKCLRLYALGLMTPTGILVRKLLIG